MKRNAVGHRAVLVVDDEPPVRSFLRTALEHTARVVEAEDGERALDILRTHGGDTIDLVLVDYILPKRSGLEVLELTKRNWPWIPVVLFTAFDSEDLAVQALRAGASGYLRKPIRVGALIRSVAALTIVGGGMTLNGGTVQSFGDHPSIRRVLTFIEGHFADPITLGDAAREARLSRFHFCRLFHHETGVPFHEYLEGVRVAQAKALLADRYARITDVAYAVGFNDLSHFDKTFRKMVGQSPTEYRRSLARAS